MLKRLIRKILDRLFLRKFDDIKIQKGQIFEKHLDQNLKNIKSLNETYFKVFSQDTEDGIIQYFLKALKIDDVKFVEIGTQDYSESNTRYIYETMRCEGLIIDPTQNLNQKINSILRVWKNKMSIHNDYSSIIFAANNYDKQSKKIVFNNKIFNSNEKKWMKKINNQDIHEEFLDNLSIKFNLDDNLIYMSYEHASPYFAHEIITSIVELYNAEYMNKSLKESTEAIDLLMIEIINSVDPVIKNNIASLVQNHYQQKMFASIKPALSFIEPPYVPDNKSSPGVVFYTLLGVLLGLVIGCIYVLYEENKNR